MIMQDVKLQKYFNLEKHDLLFKQAITPKSCGGGEEFKLLALLGDRLLNLELFEILTLEGIQDSGTMTKHINNYNHNEDILTIVGRSLKIEDLMIPTDLNHVISKDELKESVEALIGASFKAHGFGPHKEIIQKLYEIIKRIESKIKEKKQLQHFYENPKGKLQELFDKFHFPLPNYDTKSIGLIEDQPPFKCVLTGSFFEKDYEIESASANRKIDAEKDAAVKFLMKLEGDPNWDKIIQPKEITIKEQEKNNQFSIPEEISFQKLSLEGELEEIKISSGTGETLVDWAKRKSKRPFSMLFLLANRIENLSSCSWHASITNGELIISYNNLNNKDYFEIGYGTSKTKAKKEVARRFIENSNLFEWLEKNYGDKLI